MRKTVSSYECVCVFKCTAKFHWAWCALYTDIRVNVYATASLYIFSTDGGGGGEFLIHKHYGHFRSIDNDCVLGRWCSFGETTTTAVNHTPGDRVNCRRCGRRAMVQAGFRSSVYTYIYVRMLKSCSGVFSLLPSTTHLSNDIGVSDDRRKKCICLYYILCIYKDQRYLLYIQGDLLSTVSAHLVLHLHQNNI